MLAQMSYYASIMLLCFSTYYAQILCQHNLEDPTHEREVNKRLALLSQRYPIIMIAPH